LLLLCKVDLSATRAVVSVLDLLNELARPLLEFALPPRCPGCGSIVDGDHRFCIACWRQLDFLGSPQCVQCAFPMPFQESDDVRCGPCLAAPPAFDRTYAAASYGDLTRKLALKLNMAASRRPPSPLRSSWRAA